MTSHKARTEVVFGATVEKQLRKIPKHIRESLRDWAEAVERQGIRSARMIPGRHDEPLRGAREGQRSVRLSKAYRAIYIETVEGVALLVIEVNKHAY